jgi:predicted RNA-binding protein with PUA-like domain
MACYLLKTEPDAYSYDDLVKDKQTVWDGITNALALKHLRGVVKGDTLIIYHTGKEKQAVGLARAAGNAYADPKAGDPKRAVVDIKAWKRLPAPVTLAACREDAVLGKTDLVRISRLSVVPFTDAQLARLLKLAGA